MEKTSVKNEKTLNCIGRNRSFQKQTPRDTSLNYRKFREPNSELHVVPKRPQSKGISSISNYPVTTETKRLIPKHLEEKLKQLLSKLTVKKLADFKRERQTPETEKLYSSFLWLFSDLDRSINIKGLKINPNEVMMNYLNDPGAVNKTLHKTELALKSLKISESNFYLENASLAYSIFLNISAESLGSSKTLYSFLEIIFECCGMITETFDKPKNLSDPDKVSVKPIKKPEKNSDADRLIVKSLKKPEKFPESDRVLTMTKPEKYLEIESFENKTLLIAKTALEFFSGPSRISKNTKSSSKITKKDKEIDFSLYCKTSEDKPGKPCRNDWDQIEDFFNVVRPPRISQKYLENKYAKNRSMSAVSLNVK